MLLIGHSTHVTRGNSGGRATLHSDPRHAHGASRLERILDKLSALFRVVPLLRYPGGHAKARGRAIAVAYPGHKREKDGSIREARTDAEIGDHERAAARDRCASDAKRQRKQEKQEPSHVRRALVAVRFGESYGLFARLRLSSHRIAAIKIEKRRPKLMRAPFFSANEPASRLGNAIASAASDLRGETPNKRSTWKREKIKKAARNRNERENTTNDDARTPAGQLTSSPATLDPPSLTFFSAIN